MHRSRNSLPTWAGFIILIVSALPTSSALAINSHARGRSLFHPQANLMFPGSSGITRALRRPSLTNGQRGNGSRTFVLRSTSAIESKPLGTTRRERAAIQITTLLRVGIPSILAGFASYFAFPALAKLTTPSSGAIDFTGQFLSVIGLLYGLLVGQTYGFVYTQQEAIYYALYNEVTEAKSLLEQVALVCQGRSMYPQVLRSIREYVVSDLKQVNVDPSVLLSARPADDPLESIMYLTSVGVPSHVYETIRTLRQARAARLGALQRKIPKVHIILLWFLAGIMLLSFPILGAGTQVAGAYKLSTVEGFLFGMTGFAVVLTKRLVNELLRPTGGAYNVDQVLRVMVRGLEIELDERITGRRTINKGPSQPTEA